MLGCWSTYTRDEFGWIGGGGLLFLLWTVFLSSGFLFATDIVVTCVRRDHGALK